MKSKKTFRRKRIKYRIRKKVSGTTTCPRLSIYRSNKQIYAQIIDDNGGATLCEASTKIAEIAGEKNTKIEQSHKVGKLLAQRAIEKGISNVVFDRGGYLYHGRVKSLAEGAREGGLKF